MKLRTKCLNSVLLEWTRAGEVLLENIVTGPWANHQMTSTLTIKQALFRDSDDYRCNVRFGDMSEEKGTHFAVVSAYVIGLEGRFKYC